MEIRKLKGTNIFNGTTFLGANKVLVIDKDGTIQAIINEEDAGSDVEIYDAILSPGFINTHCHIELSHLKNKIPTSTGLVQFILQILKLRGYNEQKLEAMQAAEDELYQSGTVAVGDICNTIDSLALKKDSKLYWQNFIEVSGFVDAMAHNKMEDILEIANVFKTTLNKPRQVSIVPHAPYSVSKSLFELINAQANNKTISIHNQETRTENDFFKNKTGDFLNLYQSLGINIDHFEATQKSSLQTWMPYITNTDRVIAVHNTFTSVEDINFAKLCINPHKLFYCLCPNANLYIENCMPNINLFIENNCNIVLGTDSYASNTSLNIYEEIKTIKKYFPEIAMDKILQWATFNGSKALGVEDKFGSFHIGKKPGVVLITNEYAKRLV